MKRLAALVVVALAGFVFAVAAFSSPQREGCPLDGAKDDAHSGRFEGPVRIDQTEHVLRVTQDGRPVTGAKVCINTEMVGMSGMGYTAKGRELAPGRYQVRFQFGMAGDYRANVVTRDSGGEVSIPLTFKVQPAGTRSPAAKKPDAGTNRVAADQPDAGTDTNAAKLDELEAEARERVGVGTLAPLTPTPARAPAR